MPESKKTLSYYEPLIKHAYDQTLTKASRLALIATAEKLDSDGPIAERQELLALSDLADFAYHARRLIDLTSEKKSFNQINIEVAGDVESLKIYELLGIVIHHIDVKIIRTEFEFKLHLGDEDPIDLMLSDAPNKATPTLVLIKSDKHHFKLFRLKDLIEIFQEDILNTVIDTCAKNKIFLEDF